jgi:hypothetical protein
MVGNGVADWDSDVWPSAIELYKQFNFIPQRKYDQWVNLGCEEYFNGVKPSTGKQPDCDNLFEWILNQLGTLNIYDLYRYQYQDNGILKSQNKFGETLINGEKKTYQRGSTIHERNAFMMNKQMPPKVAEIYKNNLLKREQTLLGDGVSDYANLQGTRDALHIPIQFTDPWQQCNNAINTYWHY